MSFFSRKPSTETTTDARNTQPSLHQLACEVFSTEKQVSEDLNRHKQARITALDETIDATRKTIRAVSTMTDAEAEAAAKKEYLDNLKTSADTLQRALEVTENLTSLNKELRGVVPPENAEWLKRSIEMSLEVMQSEANPQAYAAEIAAQARPLSGAEWRAQKLDTLQQNLETATGRQAQMIAEVSASHAEIEGGRKFIKALGKQKPNTP